MSNKVVVHQTKVKENILNIYGVKSNSDSLQKSKGPHSTHKYLQIKNGQYIYDYNKMSPEQHDVAAKFHHGQIKAYSNLQDKNEKNHYDLSELHTKLANQKREQKVLSHTNSGKAIYENKLAKDYDDKFTKDDHIEAIQAHMKAHLKLQVPKVTPENLKNHEKSEDHKKIALSHVEKVNTVGKTSSGKDVVEGKLMKDYSDFTSEDHTDAAKLHSDLALNLKSQERWDKAIEHEGHATSHKQQAFLKRKPVVEEVKPKIEDEIQVGHNRVIGKTTTGKDIYNEFSHEGHKDFTGGEHREAANLHHSLATKVSAGKPFHREQRNLHHEKGESLGNYYDDVTSEESTYQHPVGSTLDITGSDDSGLPEGVYRVKDTSIVDDDPTYHLEDVNEKVYPMTKDWVEKKGYHENSGHNVESLDQDLEKSGIEPTMKEFKEGTLKDSHGNKVTERKQAIAIGLSEEKDKVKKSLVEGLVDRLEKSEITEEYFDSFVTERLGDYIEKSEVKEKTSVVIVLVDALEKGQLSQAFSYGNDTSVEFDKKGSELRLLATEKLGQCTQKLEDLERHILHHYQKLTEQGIKVPVFAKDCTNYYNCTVPCINGISTGSQGPTEQDLEISKYNEKIWQYIDTKQDLRVLEVFLENLKDDKEYKLNINQLLSFEKGGEVNELVSNSLEKADVLEKAKALPVGTINKWGEKKMGDGSWKYVGKSEHKGEESVEGKSSLVESLNKLLDKKDAVITIRKDVSGNKIVYVNGQTAYNADDIHGTASNEEFKKKALERAYNNSKSEFKTQSGKTIHEDINHPEHKNFTKQDHEDAKKHYLEKNIKMLTSDPGSTLEGGKNKAEYDKNVKHYEEHDNKIAQGDYVTPEDNSDILNSGLTEDDKKSAIAVRNLMKIEKLKKDIQEHERIASEYSKGGTKHYTEEYADDMVKEHVRAAKELQSELAKLNGKEEPVTTETHTFEVKPNKSLDKYKSLRDTEKIDINGVTHKLGLIKHGTHTSCETPDYSVTATNPETGEIKVIPHAIKYETGYDQGHASSMQYYPNVAGYGTGNGGGRTSPSTPILYDRERDHLKRIFEGKSYDKKYSDSILTFPKGTKVDEIKNQLN